MDTTFYKVLATTGRVIALQVGIGVVVAFVFLEVKGKPEMLAAAYGAVLGVLSAFLLGWSVVNAAATVRRGYRGFSAMLYMGAIQRFVLMLAMFWIGLKRLDLIFFPMVLGFAFSHLGYLFGARPQ